MRVFVAGATGVLGWRAVRELIATGHEVSAVARSDEKAALLEGLGARPVSVDLFDPAAVAGAVAGHQAVCNLATQIPDASRAMLPGAWATNDRLRTEASRNLAEAALATGAERFVQESVSFLYPDSGDAWLDESAPLAPVPYVRSTLDAEASAARLSTAGKVGIVLRFAMFYGPDSSHTVDAVRAARWRMAFHFGNADSYLSSVHTEDAASAVAASLHAPAGIYNVGDDEPLARRHHAEVVAGALGVRRLHLPPRGLARLGGSKAELLTRSQRISNARLRKATGWGPRYSSVVEGFPAVVAAMTPA